MKVPIYEILILVLRSEGLYSVVIFRNPAFHKPVYIRLIVEEDIHPSILFSKDLVLVPLLSLDLKNY